MRTLIQEKNTGFTLVELLVSMGIGMAILAAVASTFMTQTKYLNAQEQINEMQQNARGALDVMVREIKMAGYDPTKAACGAFNFDGATYSTSQLQIKSNLDGIGGISTSSSDNEQITYAYDSTNRRITRTVGTTGGTAPVLADNIDGFTFDYLDAAGASTTVSANVRQVSLTITARTANPDPNYTANNGYRQYQVSASVTPPNLGINDGC